MGEIRGRMRLENQDDRSLFNSHLIPKKGIRVQEVEGVVDTGAVLLLLPKDLVEVLGLKTIERTVVLLADERRIEMDLAGPIFLTLCGRGMMTDCLVGPIGCGILIGQVILERLDLICDPLKRTVTPRPESPYMPTLGLRRSALPKNIYSSHVLRMGAARRPVRAPSLGPQR